MAASSPDPSADPDPHALLGLWDLDRRVTDRLAGLTGRMWGTLTVSDDTLAPVGSANPAVNPGRERAVGPGRELAADPGRRAADLRCAAVGLRCAAVGLKWEEGGTLYWAGNRLDAHRRLALRLIGDEWWMTFENGGLFHRWQPDQRLDHPCSADRYVGWIHLDPDGRQMRILWAVTGPSKRQRIFTRYQRRDDSSLGIEGYRSGDAL